MPLNFFTKQMQPSLNDFVRARGLDPADFKCEVYLAPNGDVTLAKIVRDENGKVVVDYERNLIVSEPFVIKRDAPEDQPFG